MKLWSEGTAMQLLAELSGRLAGWVQAQAQQGSDFPARAWAQAQPDSLSLSLWAAAGAAPQRAWQSAVVCSSLDCWWSHCSTS